MESSKIRQKISSQLHWSCMKIVTFLKNKATCSLPALRLEAILLGQITLSFWSVEHPWFQLIYTESAVQQYTNVVPHPPKWVRINQSQEIHMNTKKRQQIVTTNNSASRFCDIFLFVVIHTLSGSWDMMKRIRCYLRRILK